MSSQLGWRHYGLGNTENNILDIASKNEKAKIRIFMVTKVCDSFK